MRILLLIATLLLPYAAEAATRDFVVNWSQVCETVDGDTLDADGDGICEDLVGFRVYTEAGQFINGLPEDGTRQFSFRINVPWGTSCFKMTSTMLHPITGELLESDWSNIGACKDVVPGKPRSPVLTN